MKYFKTYDLKGLQKCKYWPRGPGFGLPLEGDVLLLNGLNPKFEDRNPKQIRNSNAQMLKTSKKVCIA